MLHVSILNCPLQLPVINGMGPKGITAERAFIHPREQKMRTLLRPKCSFGPPSAASRSQVISVHSEVEVWDNCFQNKKGEGSEPCGIPALFHQ